MSNYITEQYRNSISISSTDQPSESDDSDLPNAAKAGNHGWDEIVAESNRALKESPSGISGR